MGLPSSGGRVGGEREGDMGVKLTPERGMGRVGRTGRAAFKDGGERGLRRTGRRGLPVPSEQPQEHGHYSRIRGKLTPEDRVAPAIVTARAGARPLLLLQAQTRTQWVALAVAVAGAAAVLPPAYSGPLPFHAFQR